MTVIQIIGFVAIAIVSVIGVVTRTTDNNDAKEFEKGMYKQHINTLTLLDAMIDSNGKANKAILDAIDRRNCEVLTIKNKLDGLDKTFTYRGYIRRLLRVRNSWQNGTLSDAEAMKKISDMLAEIREKEKLE